MSRPTKHTGAFCEKCRMVFDDATCPFWHWTKSQAMHERGTGHKMKRFHHGKVDLLALAYDGELREL